MKVINSNVKVLALEDDFTFKLAGMATMSAIYEVFGGDNIEVVFEGIGEEPFSVVKPDSFDDMPLESQHTWSQAMSVLETFYLSLWAQGYPEEAVGILPKCIAHQFTATGNVWDVINYAFEDGSIFEYSDEATALLESMLEQSADILKNRFASNFEVSTKQAQEPKKQATSFSDLADDANVLDLFFGALNGLPVQMKLVFG